MQMELISRKEFDSRVTSGELDNLQAIKVKRRLFASLGIRAEQIAFLCFAVRI